MAMNFLRSIKNVFAPRPKPEVHKTDWKYQLVLQFPHSGLEDYDNLVAMEKEISKLLGTSALVDGHDAGSGEMNMFIHTNEPEGVFNRILLANRTHPLFIRLTVGYRAFEAEDFIVLWPKTFTGQFKII